MIAPHQFSLSNQYPVRLVLSGRETGNLSFKQGDDPAEVWEARTELVKKAGGDADKLISVANQHGVTVVRVDDSHAGTGAREVSPLVGDALMTDVPGVPLLMMVADCGLLYLYDPEHHAVALIHAGWKGCFHNILQETVDAMKDAYGSSPDQLYVGRAPMISGKNYLIDEQAVANWRTYEGFKDSYLVRTPVGVGIDLPTILKDQALKAGIPSDHMELMNICTYDHVEEYFSYRREDGKTGRFGLLAILS